MTQSPQSSGPSPGPSDQQTSPPDDQGRRPEDARPAKDPLRGSATSRFWLALVALLVVLLALVVFVAQNTGRVAVSFLGWTGHPPLAVAILVSVVAGLALAVIAGTLRIWQLHRRVRRDRATVPRPSSNG